MNEAALVHIGVVELSVYMNVALSAFAVVEL